MGNLFFWTTYAALWLLLLGLFAAVFFIYRYLGQQLLNSPQGRATQGPEVGTRLPSAQLLDVDGNIVQWGQHDRLPMLLLFVSTSCSACQRALASLSDLAHQNEGAMKMVLVCQGRTSSEIRAFGQALPDNVELVPDTR